MKLECSLIMYCKCPLLCFCNLLEYCAIAKTKSAWEHELGEDFADNWWVNAVNRTHSSSICARLSLIQFKIQHRVHISKALHSAIYCNLSHVLLFLLLFFCPVLRNNWNNHFETLSTIFKTKVYVCLTTTIFGFFSSSSKNVDCLHCLLSP